MAIHSEQTTTARVESMHRYSSHFALTSKPTTTSVGQCASCTTSRSHSNNAEYPLPRYTRRVSARLP